MTLWLGRLRLHIFKVIIIGPYIEDCYKELNAWSTVLPDKVGCVSSSPNRESVAVISASKFSVLSVEEVEEGELLVNDPLDIEEENKEEEDISEEREVDLIEDAILDQKMKGKEKSGGIKGGKKVQRTKAQGENSKSKRSSRRKL